MSRGVAGMQEFVALGNIDARRDWGHARDYVEGMWRILQQDAPDDYVLATGVTTSVRSFVEAAFRVVNMEIRWRGSGATLFDRTRFLERCKFLIDHSSALRAPSP